MSVIEIENLIETLRECLQHAKDAGDSFEYYRLCEELRLAQSALVTSLKTTGKTAAFGNFSLSANSLSFA
jgi:hypothetical protein